MGDSSKRLGALSGKWDVPDPGDLLARLQPEPDVEESFYASSLPISDGPIESGDDDSVSEVERQRAFFEIFRVVSGGYRWRLMGRNGHLLADSGTEYPSADRCRKAIDQLRDLTPEAEVRQPQ